MDEKKVFISYSRDDKEIVFPLVERLKKDVGDVFWIDLDGVECGAQYEKIIINAIDKAEIVLLMYSDNIINSKWVEKEATYSEDSEKKLVPVIINGDKMKGWPKFRYASIDSINIKDSNQYKKLVRDLIKWLGLNKEQKNKSISTSTGTSHSIARNQNDKYIYITEKPHSQCNRSDSISYSTSYGFNNPQKSTSKTIYTTSNNENKQSNQFNSSSDSIKKSFFGSLNTSEKDDNKVADKKDDTINALSQFIENYSKKDTSNDLYSEKFLELLQTLAEKKDNNKDAAKNDDAINALSQAIESYSKNGSSNDFYSEYLSELLNEKIPLDNKNWDNLRLFIDSNKDNKFDIKYLNNKNNFLKKNYKPKTDLWRHISTSPSPTTKITRFHNSTDSSTKKDEEKLETTLTFDYHDKKIEMKRLGNTSYYFGSFSGKNDSFIDKLSDNIRSAIPGNTLGTILGGGAIAAALTFAIPFAPTLAGFGIWGAKKLFFEKSKIDDFIEHLRDKYSLNFKRLPKKYATGHNLDEDIIMLDWDDREI